MIKTSNNNNNRKMNQSKQTITKRKPVTKSAGSKTPNGNCSRCRRPLAKNYSKRTCEKCLITVAEKRKLNKSKNEVICAAMKTPTERCKYKANPKCGNKYCMIHQKLWLQEQEDPHARRCSSRRQCDPDKPRIKAILPPGYAYNTCENCRLAENIQANKRNHNIQSINMNLAKSGSNLRRCRKCSADKMYPIEEMGKKQDGSVAELCLVHYNAPVEIDRRRERVHDPVAYKDYYENRGGKEKKIEWRKNNPGKVYEYYSKSRAKKLAEDPVGYRKKQAENAKRWRENNPELAKKHKSMHKRSVKVLHGVYKKRALLEGIDFNVDMDVFEKYVKSNCYYCGKRSNIRLLGIDRIDNNNGYNEGNMVSCCKQCNMMKNSLNVETFVLMCAHISHCNKIIKEKYYFPHVFHNWIGSSFNNYKIRAENKDIDFTIDNDYYNDIVKKPCYICHRTPQVKNGLDRYNNSKGYTKDNIRSCCGSCNFLKKKTSHDYLIFHCAFIASHHADRIKSYINTWTPSKHLENNTGKNKLSAEEKEALMKKNREDRHLKTMSTKTPEAIAKRAKEIDDNHKKNISSE